MAPWSAAPGNSPRPCMRSSSADPATPGPRGLVPGVHSQNRPGRKPGRHVVTAPTGSEMSSQRSPSARDVMRHLTALPTTTGVRESLEDRQTAGQVGRATMPGHEEVHCSACWKMAKPASDVLPPFAKHKLHRCSRRTLPHPTPRTGWPLPPCSMLNPKSPGNSGRGGVLKPLCTRISQKHPPSKETTGKHSRSSKPVWWACQDLNQRPHPYQVSSAKRFAERRSPGHH